MLTIYGVVNVKFYIEILYYFTPDYSKMAECIVVTT